MDIFNRDKIEYLEKRVKFLDSWLKEMQDNQLLFVKKSDEAKCYGIADAMPERSVILMLVKEVEAIKDYLKIGIEEIWEDDPMYPPPIRKQRRVFRAYKLKKKE